jgi:hypothetical protein
LGWDVTQPSPTTYYVGEKGVLIPIRRRQPAPGQTGPRTGGQQAPPTLEVTDFLLLANGKPVEFARPQPSIPRTIGHYQEWIAAAKGGKPAHCHFEYARLFAETALLGVIAVRTGKDLSYDAEQARFTNDAEANEFVNPPYRQGWTL